MSNKYYNISWDYFPITNWGTNSDIQLIHSLIINPARSLGVSQSQALDISHLLGWNTNLPLENGLAAPNAAGFHACAAGAALPGRWKWRDQSMQLQGKTWEKHQEPMNRWP